LAASRHRLARPAVAENRRSATNTAFALERDAEVAKRFSAKIR